MRYSQVFPKTLREAPKEAVTANHKLLVRAGFIDQLMAGSWTLLPLGWRVVTKINQIIREEMNAIGCQEMLMPLLHPKEIWNQTGRWEAADEVMYKLKDTRGRDFVLSFTHEEIVMDLMKKHIRSYKDLPLNVYHFSTKFRNELRAQGGILRGREFLMKDAYSLHESEEDLMIWYEKYKQAYLKIFERIGLDVYVTEASGGVFTDKHTHEFQVEAEAGEDTIYIKPGTKEGYNKEVFEGDVKQFDVKRCIEVGNIFPLGKMYSEKMGASFIDRDGSKNPIWFGSYGIGPTRVMGTIIEVSHDDRGIIWPKSVAPFQAHLVDLKNGEEIYEKLTDAGIEVLWDDTDRPAGQKFADVDLIGVPVRLVVSEKTLRQAQGKQIEWKERASDKTELLSLEEVVERMKK
ncbi:MAG: prolyl-tRNA synthetase [Microgenomates group bacterium Gr01-1014_16]|nr:MAG: prolyl-tRNA synthetase [Microgenomates group bacterium Gr01-1014_16]